MYCALNTELEQPVILLTIEWTLQITKINLQCSFTVIVVMYKGIRPERDYKCKNENSSDIWSGPYKIGYYYYSTK